MRWTYAADLQAGTFVRSEFQVVVSDWTVTGTNRTYSVAGPGSLRIEDDARAIGYSANWGESRGNYWEGAFISRRLWEVRSRARIKRRRRTCCIWGPDT